MDGLAPELTGGLRDARRQSHGEELAEDSSIQSTNDDATSCKRYAVHLGYWNDPYIDYFHKMAPESKKPPEINRGYWARVTAIKNVVLQFLTIAGPEAQILSLGGGYDTLFWRLVDEGAQFANYTEVDFPEITAKKIHAIEREGQILKRQLSPDANEVEIVEHISLFSPRYNVVGSDLRSVRGLKGVLEACSIQPSAPTLILAECVLIYMSEDQSATLLTFLASIFPISCFVNYEQANIDDKFGHVMQDNLYNRGVCLAGFRTCKDLESQKQRFLDAGYSNCKVWTLTNIYAKLSSQERKRIEALEFLDEVELLTQLLDHYCLCVATRDVKKRGLEAIGF